MIIAVDFDGTIVMDDFPDIGYPVPNAINTIQKLIDNDHKIVLWTARSGKYLDEAVEFLRDEGITLWGINSNPTQHKWSSSPKAHCDMFIDDKAFGCPLMYDVGSDTYHVEWTYIQENMVMQGII